MYNFTYRHNMEEQREKAETGQTQYSRFTLFEVPTGDSDVIKLPL